MSNVSKTNHFFKKHVYSNLGKFALSPVSWAFETKSSAYIPMPDFRKLIVAAFLAPVLIPATIVTSLIALCLAAVSALIHGLSLVGAKIADSLSCCSDDNAHKPAV